MISKLGSYKQRAYAFISIALVILLACFSYLFSIRMNLGGIQDDILHNEIIMNIIYEANTDLLQAEAAERGYILTQDPWFLENYTTAKTSFLNRLAYLDSLTSPLNSREKIFLQMDSLGNTRIMHLDEMIRLNDMQNPDTAIQFIENGYGKELMDTYSDLSDQMANITSQRINESKTSLSNNYFKDLEITVAVGIIAIMLVTTLFIYFYRSQQKISEYNEKLEVRNQELQQFSYIASHDLKEPLRMVKNFLGLLEKKYKGQLDNNADKYIHFAVDGAERMQQLIDDLLEFSRVGRSESQKEVVDFYVILKDVKRNISALIAQHEAAIYIDSKLPELSVFKHEITRVFQNLISNAIKFHKPGVPPEIHISCIDKKTSWLFKVRDNGIGIPKDRLAEVFEIFNRLHSKESYPGTGIGLAITKKIIERHGGDIWVESQVNHGSTFYFTLKR